MTSDHSPVFATFEVGVTSQFVSKKGKTLALFLNLNSSFRTSLIPFRTSLRKLLTFYIISFSAGLPKCLEQAYIEFESIEAIVKTASRTKFFIEFYSTCLEGEKCFSKIC